MHKLWQHIQLSLFDDTPHYGTPSGTTTPDVNAGEIGLRSIDLLGQSVSYRIERARRKTVGMLIDGRGLRVRAPARVSVAEVERILQSKSAWILRSLSRLSSQESAPKAICFVPELALDDGACIQVLGHTLVLRWGEFTRVPEYNAALGLQAQEILVKQPKQPKSGTGQSNPAAHQNTWEDKQRNAVAEVLGEYLLSFVHQRAQHLARTHGLSYRSIVLSNARTLWGTCRRDGLIRLNWRLVFLDARLVEYVLAHELAHTVQMNHSPKFWLVVEQLCPDYRSLRKQMRAYDLRNA